MQIFMVWCNVDKYERKIYDEIEITKLSEELRNQWMVYKSILQKKNFNLMLYDLEGEDQHFNME